MNTDSILVLICAYYNHDLLDRTIQSVKQNQGNFNVDICILENPSENSKFIQQVTKKHNVNHMIAEKNIAGNIITAYINQNIKSLDKYNYICTSDGDVVLDNGCIEESIDIIKQIDKAKMCYISLKTDLEKYSPISNKIKKWVEPPKDCGSYQLCHTGNQFWVFQKEYLLSFIAAVNSNAICSRIALGSKQYTGFSDNNLRLFNSINKTPFVATKYNQLDHIGWETALGLNPEYKKLKLNNLKNKIIRHENMSEVDLNNIKLTKIL